MSLLSIRVGLCRTTRTRLCKTAHNTMTSSSVGVGVGVGGSSDKTNQMYLHVAPCGDYWTGHEVFAAKHLNPDYVKSIAFPKDDATFDPEEILEDYEGDLDELLKKVYDTGDISLIEEVKDQVKD